jgi:S-adenosylmethionine-diacylglycerol 3-amino-3-carboxypropyl transferase
VEGSVAAAILQRVEAVCTRLDPANNPYLQWIVTGHHRSALPFALRPENFEAIQRNLDCLEWHCTSLEAFLIRSDANWIDQFNLSNVFEWMSPEHCQQLLAQLVRTGRSQGRLVYWNLLVDRQRPLSMAHQLQPLTDLAQALYQRNHVFFYKNLVIEEIF